MSKSIQIKAGTTRQETALTVALEIHIAFKVLQDFEAPPTSAPRPPTTVANPHIDRFLGSKETHIQSHNLWDRRAVVGTSSRGVLLMAVNYSPSSSRAQRPAKSSIRQWSTWSSTAFPRGPNTSDLFFASAGSTTAFTNDWSWPYSTAHVLTAGDRNSAEEF